MIGALVIGLIGSALLNVKLYALARCYYASLSRVQLDPDGTRWSLRLPGPEIFPQGIDLLIIGDSRAQDWVMKTRASVVNAGISGQTTTQILARYRAQGLAYGPRVILIQAGINDLKAIPLLPGKEREIIDLCKVQLKAMVQLARQQGAQVILTTIIPPGEVPLERRLVWSGEINTALREVNSFLLTLRAEGVDVIDPAKCITDPHGRIAAGFRKNFLHLNEAGYAALNRDISALLATHGISLIPD